MKRLPLILAAIICLCVTTACRRTPRHVLPQEPMARLLVDLHMADAVMSDQMNLRYEKLDTGRAAMRRAVLQRHGVSEAELDSSLNWYGRNLPRLIEVLERVDTIFADSLRALDAAELAVRQAIAGDTLQMWTLAPSQVIEGHHYLTFEMPVDTAFRRGDVLQWQFVVHNADRHPLKAVVGVDYANKGRSTDMRLLELTPRDTKRVDLLLQTDRQRSVKRIWGYLFLPVDSGRRAFVDSISLQRTHLIDDEYTSRRHRIRSVQRQRGL